MESSPRSFNNQNETDSSVSSFVTSFFERKSYHEGDKEREDELREVHKDGLLAHGYDLRHRVGRGGSGVVYFCCHSPSKTRRAVKIMRRSITSDQYHEIKMNMIIKEKMDTQVEANTPPSLETERAGFCLLIDHFTIDTPLGDRLCIVYPLLGSPISFLRNTMSPFSTDQERIGLIQEVSLSVTLAVAKLHKIGICHADFRPANILLGDGPGNINVIDFGQAIDTSTLSSHPTHRAIPLCYAAPETVCYTVPKLSFKMDIWSLACTLYELRCGDDVPFRIYPHPGNVKQWEAYLGGMFSVLGCPEEAEMLGSEDDGSGFKVDGFAVELDEGGNVGDGVLTANERRSNLRHAMQMVGIPDFSEAEMADFADLLERLLRWNPVERPTVEEAMKHVWFSTTYE